MHQRTTHTMHPTHGLISHEDYIAICNLNYQLAKLPTHRRTLRTKLRIYLRTTSAYQNGQA